MVRAGAVAVAVPLAPADSPLRVIAATGLTVPVPKATSVVLVDPVDEAKVAGRVLTVDPGVAPVAVLGVVLDEVPGTPPSVAPVPVLSAKAPAPSAAV